MAPWQWLSLGEKQKPQAPNKLTARQSSEVGAVKPWLGPWQPRKAGDQGTGLAPLGGVTSFCSLPGPFSSHARSDELYGTVQIQMHLHPGLRPKQLPPTTYGRRTAYSGRAGRDTDATVGGAAFGPQLQDNPPFCGVEFASASASASVSAAAQQSRVVCVSGTAQTGGIWVCGALAFWGGIAVCVCRDGPPVDGLHPPHHLK
ncbi:hypothetical protein B0J13DRAFT_521819 [Dactylonectria estremocensis]|uniref:Uncharacterized protein n=1 Tax=Dactylonectria estremocensis TaxID=1079267 RepID=A0A9P9F7S5_9HYPO|nr:hypothetical protein B0J13DRAFT_521819 [Dactylonectria estremocensis]